MGVEIKLYQWLCSNVMLSEMNQPSSSYGTWVAYSKEHRLVILFPPGPRPCKFMDYITMLSE